MRIFVRNLTKLQTKSHRIILKDLCSAVLAALCVIVIGCGERNGPTDQISPAATACPAGSASLEVGDGYFRVLCGCTGANETPGTVFGASSGLTCHLGADTSVVFFHYLSATLNHQVIPTGSPQFLVTYTPALQRVDAASSFTPGATHSFLEAYSGLTGQIITP